MQVDDIRVTGKGYDKIRHRRADIADHNARDQKRRHIADLSGNQKNEARRDQRADKGRENQRIRRKADGLPHIKDHDQRNHHLGARRNAEHKGSRNRIFKESLEHEAGKGQCPAQNGSHQNPRQADAPDDIHLGLAAFLAEDDLRDFSGGQMHASRIDVQNRNQNERCRQDYKNHRPAQTASGELPVKALRRTRAIPFAVYEICHIPTPIPSFFPGIPADRYPVR